MRDLKLICLEVRGRLIDFMFRGRSYHYVMFEFEFVILLKKWVEL